MNNLKVVNWYLRMVGSFEGESGNLGVFLMWMMCASATTCVEFAVQGLSGRGCNE